MKKITLAIFLTCIISVSFGQKGKTENVIIVTLDGMRWQDVFGGADEELINNPKYSYDTASLKKKFWAGTEDERRKKLMPFFWNTIATKGQLYGNRKYGNNVNNANRYWFSYPGYNEIFTGYPDTAVNSNDKIPNKNESVLAFLNKRPEFNGKIAAFTSWDVFDAIFNEEKYGFLVSSGFDKLPAAIANTPELQLLNEMQFQSPKPLGNGVRPDYVTYYLAKCYLKKYQPRVLYIAFDETDDYAHGGRYDYYLNYAYLNDQWIADLWNTIQSLPAYKDKTTLLITTDHGRGDKTKSEWTSHGEKILDASEIWIAAIGPDTKPLGELKGQTQLYQKQVAGTIAALLGLQFKTDHPVAEPIQGIILK